MGLGYIKTGALQEKKKILFKNPYAGWRPIEKGGGGADFEKKTKKARRPSAKKRE